MPASSVAPKLGAVSDAQGPGAEREYFIDNLLVRIHFIIAMIRGTGIAPWEFEFPFPGFSPRCAASRRGRISSGISSRPPSTLRRSENLRLLYSRYRS